MAPTKGAGGHIGSVRILSASAPHFLYPWCLLNQWVEFNQTFMDILLGQALELIRF